MNSGLFGHPSNLSAQDKFSIVRSPIICLLRRQNIFPNNHYSIVYNVQTTLVLPSITRPGDIIWISNNSNIFTHVVARNGKRINQANEDLILDVPDRIVCLRYVNDSIGWLVT
ncbi:MAG: hypothetical protein NZZ41_00385 [Candidatus Dojkabacteria bacterium]|nr:hypothetical protein [Candidatus Dojkabacteria bacterium]